MTVSSGGGDVLLKGVDGVVGGNLSVEAKEGDVTFDATEDTYSRSSSLVDIEASYGKTSTYKGPSFALSKDGQTKVKNAPTASGKKGTKVTLTDADIKKRNAKQTTNTSFKLKVEVDKENTDIVQRRGGTITAGGDARVIAGQNLTSVGGNVDASGNVDVKAGGNIDLKSAESSVTYSQKSVLIDVGGSNQNITQYSKEDGQKVTGKQTITQYEMEKTQQGNLDVKIGPDGKKVQKGSKTAQLTGKVTKGTTSEIDHQTQTFTEIKTERDRGQNYGALNVGVDVAVKNYESTTHDQAGFSSGGKLSLKSGGDTSLTGAKLSGREVDADIGGTLTIRSVVDTENYNATEFSSYVAGGKANIKAKPPKAGVSIDKGGKAYAMKPKTNKLTKATSFLSPTVKGDLDRVLSTGVELKVTTAKGDSAIIREQSGIVGQGLVNVDVGGKTTLDLGIIASDTDGQTQLDTSDIEIQRQTFEGGVNEKSADFNVSLRPDQLINPEDLGSGVGAGLTTRKTRQSQTVQTTIGSGSVTSSFEGYTAARNTNRDASQANVTSEKTTTKKGGGFGNHEGRDLGQEIKEDLGERVDNAQAAGSDLINTAKDNKATLESNIREGQQELVAAVVGDSAKGTSTTLETAAEERTQTAYAAPPVAETVAAVTEAVGSLKETEVKLLVAQPKVKLAITVSAAMKVAVKKHASIEKIPDTEKRRILRTAGVEVDTSVSGEALTELLQKSVAASVDAGAGIASSLGTTAFGLSADDAGEMLKVLGLKSEE